MSSINKVIFLGNLGADPELRFTPRGDAVCNIRLATSEKWRDKTSGNSREATEWHRIVLFRRHAEVVAKFIKKGDYLYVEGKIKTRKWLGDDGKERSSGEIEATDMRMIGAKSGDSKLMGTTDFLPPARKANESDPDWDIPF